MRWGKMNHRPIGILWERDELKICSTAVSTVTGFTVLAHCCVVSLMVCYTDLRKYFFTDRIINIWYALDDRTVTSATLNSFNNRLERLRNSKQMGLLWSSVAKDPWGRASPPSGEASSVSSRWVMWQIKTESSSSSPH